MLQESSAESLNYLKEALGILAECFKSDKRKVYHARKYAEFAIILFETFDNSEYLEQAYSWLFELIDSGEPCSRRTKELFVKVKEVRQKS